MGDIIQFTVSLCYNDIEEPTDFESISFFFQQNPVVYVIPMESVLGKLSLFPAGITGTIPFESTASNWAECEALVERYYPCSGHCCRVCSCGISMCLPPSQHCLLTLNICAFVPVVFSDFGS